MDADGICVCYLFAVINELDGLAKGSREGQYNDPIHAYQVQTGACSAIQYLEDQFDCSNKHVRALTGKGTVMDTITFRSEESSNKVGLSFERFRLG